MRDAMGRTLEVTTRIRNFGGRRGGRGAPNEVGSWGGEGGAVL